MYRTKLTTSPRFSRDGLRCGDAASVFFFASHCSLLSAAARRGVECSAVRGLRCPACLLSLSTLHECLAPPLHPLAPESVVRACASACAGGHICGGISAVRLEPTAPAGRTAEIQRREPLQRIDREWSLEAKTRGELAAKQQLGEWGRMHSLHAAARRDAAKRTRSTTQGSEIAQSERIHSRDPAIVTRQNPTHSPRHPCLRRRHRFLLSLSCLRSIVLHSLLSSLSLPPSLVANERRAE